MGHFKWRWFLHFNNNNNIFLKIVNLLYIIFNFCGQFNLIIKKNLLKTKLAQNYTKYVLLQSCSSRATMQYHLHHISWVHIYVNIDKEASESRQYHFLITFPQFKIVYEHLLMRCLIFNKLAKGQWNNLNPSLPINIYKFPKPSNNGKQKLVTHKDFLGPNFIMVLLILQWFSLSLSLSLNLRPIWIEGGREGKWRRGK